MQRHFAHSIVSSECSIDLSANTSLVRFAFLTLADLPSPPLLRLLLFLSHFYVHLYTLSAWYILSALIQQKAGGNPM